MNGEKQCQVKISGPKGPRASSRMYSLGTQLKNVHPDIFQALDSTKRSLKETRENTLNKRPRISQTGQMKIR